MQPRSRGGRRGQGASVELWVCEQVWGDPTYLEEVLEAGLSARDRGPVLKVGGLVGLIGDPSDEGDKQDSDEDGGVDLARDAQRHQSAAADDAEPGGGRGHLPAEAAVVGGAGGQAQADVRDGELPIDPGGGRDHVLAQ